MAAADTLLSADWLQVCRRAASHVERALAAEPTTFQRARETGTRGSGGDRTLVLDQTAEELVFAQLRAVHAEGHNFRALSEEHGEMSFGGGPGWVIIDPIDGSLNAKRDASHYALSLAVADGDTMADVGFAFVHDFGANEQWWAWRGHGAWRRRHGDPDHGVRLDPTLGERRWADGKLELIGIESADPQWIRDSADALVDVAHRLRALGTVAISLCQVAAARNDAMVTLKRCRGVDAAAGQLIVREAGGHVCFPDCSAPLAAPLDATPSSRLIAARSADTLEQLIKVRA